MVKFFLKAIKNLKYTDLYKYMKFYIDQFFKTQTNKKNNTNQTLVKRKNIFKRFWKVTETDRVVLF